VLGLAGPERAWHVGLEDGLLVARAVAQGFELRWRIGAAAAESTVTVRRFEVTHGSAT